MIGGEEILSSIGDALARRHRIWSLDVEAGTFELADEDRTVRVILDLDLLEEYFNQLDERNIPDLFQSAPELQDGVRKKHIAMWIEEIFDSDIYWSLLEIRLGRSANGQITLVDRRGSARRPRPLTDRESGYWSPNRPGT